MAKGRKSPSPKSPEPAALDAEVVKKVGDLKSEGNRMFANKEWGKAIEAYEAAMKMLPAAGGSGADLRSDLLCNKAACLMGLSKYKDAVKECSVALEASPSSSKALRSRAKALEKQGLYKQALADIQALNRSDGASDDSREAEKRLKDLMAGRRPSLANGGARAAAANAAAARGARSPANWPFSAKVTLGGETRLVQLTASAGYGDLQAAVAAKFPTAGPVVLRYVDGEGDLVTITSRQDLQAAFAEALKNTDKRLGVAGIPPIKVQLTQVANKSDVPPIPLEELAENRLIQQQLAAQQQAQLAAAQQAQAQAQQKQTATAVPSGDVIEIDDWLVELIGLIKETAGFDPDKHVDLQNEGFAALTRACDTALRSEEAAPLFDKAGRRFQEVAASGFTQWAQVHVHKAHRLMDVAALADQSWSKELEGAVKKEFDAAEGLLKKALDVKPDFFDALHYMASLECDRAKAAAKVLAKPLPPLEAVLGEGAAADEAAIKEHNERGTAATREALSKIKASDVKSGGKHFANAAGWFKKARAAAEAADAERKAEQEKRAGAAKEEGGAAAEGASSEESKQQEGGEGEAAAAAAANGGQQDALTTLSSHAQVLQGNSLYEWSQVLAAAGDAGWKAVLDEAVELFKSAGCADKDIRGALKNHTEVDKLDLGPDPEPEPEPEPEPAADTAAAAGNGAAAAAAKQHKAAPEAKGLPKLERKPKEKAAAAAAAAQ